jgi:hypothetical protein
LHDGAAAEAGVNRKLHELRGKAFTDSAAHDFRPFVVETGGRIAPTSYALLKELATVAAQSRDPRLQHHSEQMFLEKWLRNLSLILQSKNAKAKNAACSEAMQFAVPGMQNVNHEPSLQEASLMDAHVMEASPPQVNRWSPGVSQTLSVAYAGAADDWIPDSSDTIDQFIRAARMCDENNAAGLHNVEDTQKTDILPCQAAETDWHAQLSVDGNLLAASSEQEKQDVDASEVPTATPFSQQTLFSEAVSRKSLPGECDLASAAPQRALGPTHTMTKFDSGSRLSSPGPLHTRCKDSSPPWQYALRNLVGEHADTQFRTAGDKPLPEDLARLSRTENLVDQRQGHSSGTTEHVSSAESISPTPPARPLPSKKTLPLMQGRQSYTASSNFSGIRRPPSPPPSRRQSTNRLAANVHSLCVSTNAPLGSYTSRSPPKQMHVNIERNNECASTKNSSNSGKRKSTKAQYRHNEIRAAKIRTGASHKSHSTALPSSPVHGSPIDEVAGPLPQIHNRVSHKQNHEGSDAKALKAVGLASTSADFPCNIPMPPPPPKKRRRENSA